jgi:imidazolonepropionase
MASLAILHAAQLVTLAGPNRPRFGNELSELGIIPDGGMLIRDGLIAATGSSVEIENQASGLEIIDLEGRLVCPGFVDAHTHIVFGGNRLDDYERRARGETYQQIAAAGGGILSTVRATRAASEDELLKQAQERARWFLEGGTTTIEAKSGYGLTVADELKILRVIRALSETTALQCIPTFLGAHAIPPEHNEQSYEDLIVREMLPAVVKENLAEYADIFCEQGYFSVEQSRRILTEAKKAGLKLRMHVDQLTSSGGAALAAELSTATADHLEKTDTAGISALKKANVQPVLLPGSVYALGLQHYPRAREMIDAGLSVVLATDFNPGSSPITSMPMILSLACTQMKMSPAEALVAATINAAASLGRADTIGSLQPGKVANFSIFDCSDYRELAYWIGIPLAKAVYVRGSCVYQS